jgi:hypothetical protein
MMEKTQAQAAYDEWRKQFKVNMMVYTDEQMYCMGYEARDEYIRELIELIDALNSQIQNSSKPKRRSNA